jgi:3-oxoacyl-[acyl-carrier-protein] synthase II
MSRSLLVTGCGTINALGHDVPTFWSRLLEGACGIGPVPARFGAGSALVAGAVHDPLPASGSRVPLSRTDRQARVAAEQAVSQSRLAERYPGHRVAVIVGTTTGGIGEVEDYLIGQQAGRPARCRRLLALEKANTADALADHFGFCGPRYTVHTGCASGASAILLASDLVRGGSADAALAGGSDALARLTLSGFRSLRVLDAAPCRPFDRERRGLSLGEGAAMLVLERASAAGGPGARPLAELVSAAQTTDAHHLTAPPPSGAGAAEAMLSALERADLPPSAIDHVNAHGTGTPLNDAAEAAAIRSALGEHAACCPVTSIKGAIGHTLAAAGAIEAVAVIQTLRTGLIPHTVGLAHADPALALDLVQARPRAGQWRVALSNSFGFGGANTVLCLRRADR